ncbi:uncharacterized protein GIQ15_06197 [Arthroderma uncinatum]|uniref:uncharacterized protein n=1 Tax=Arthroderma uncinatum TaxID=74035 RepID=UPI00144A77C0|nr:uncharacterized protein GIQ15_06197 [Arthroderma uncinatum]KAF3480850.1 hypothetical protein GIQ15_06197 [Arthroderma uncinatum]
MTGQAPNGTENKPPGIKSAIQKSISWLKPKKGTSTGSTEKATTNNQSSKANQPRAPILPAPRSRTYPPPLRTIPMRGISPLRSPRGDGNATPYTVSPVSSVRPRNVLDVGQAYDFQNAMSGSMVQYGTQTRESGVVKVDNVSYQYNMDSRERLKLRRMLEKKKASGKTGVEIGKFLVETYYNRDKGLGALVTNLVLNQRPYAIIALVVMESVGLHVTSEEAYPINQRSTGGARHYGRPTPQAGHPPMPPPHRHLPQRASTGADYASPRPNPLPPLKNGERGGHILSRYETSDQLDVLTRSTANQKYIFEDDDDPPLLRPTTLNRIHRGYFDPSIDYGKRN